MVGETKLNRFHLVGLFKTFSMLTCIVNLQGEDTAYSIFQTCLTTEADFLPTYLQLPERHSMVYNFGDSFEIMLPFRGKLLLAG